MRSMLRPLLALAPMVALSAAGAPSPSHTSQADPVFAALLREALERNPDLAKARALVDAAKEQIPQAKALPDPTLSLGLQNDGFNGIQVGKMPTSYYQIMFTQPFLWPGKRGTRADVAALGVRMQDATQDRIRLTLRSDLERAYIGLILVREQLGLLDQQATYLEQAEGSARARYQVGQGNQADLLRAQLERIRLQQSRLDLVAQEQTLLATLNRLRNRASDAALETPVRLEELPLPVPASEGDWMERAASGSPDLEYARRNLEQVNRSLDLAKLNVRPDFAVSAGLMPRGGLDPMWQVNFSIGLPLYARKKQQRAVAEQEWRKKAEGQEVESVRLILRQRTQERLAQLTAAESSIRIYQQGLLVQSEATFKATLAQYEAGKVTFLAVLEALNGWVADRSGYLAALGQARAQDIALREFNLGPTPGIASAALGSPSLGMSGGSASAPASRQGMGGAPAVEASAAGSSSTSSM